MMYLYLGTYMEVAINPSGGFGSRTPVPSQQYGGTPVPSGFHNLTSRLGVVVDHGKDGWNVGTPPHTGDFLMHAFPETGWHLSWDGQQSDPQVFNNMPLFADDDDADTTFAPARGCQNCVNGKVAGCDDTFQPGNNH